MTSETFKPDRSWTLFLDRDGVINRRIVGGYVTDWDEFEFLPGVSEAMEIFSRIFGRIIVVSNQQGVGKRLMTAADVDMIHSSMVRQLEGDGARIDLVLYAPQLESEGSPMRKPGTGMALEAQRQFPDIDLSRSVMAGDSRSDLLFGRNAGMKTVLICSEPGIITELSKLYDLAFPDLRTFARKLVSR